MVHWKVLPDGSLIHRKTGYDITLRWIVSGNPERPVEDHVCEKNWATEDVMVELIEYCDLQRAKLN